MDFETIQALLMYGTVLNLGLMLIYFLMFSFAGDWVRSMHAKWFPISDEHMNTALYAVFGVWGVLWVTFFLVPWLATYLI